jgi:hypothetical protein
MTSINVINKQINELQINLIQEFIDKLKVKTPEEFHIAMDEQLKIDKALINVTIKNINKKTKKINNQDTPKKTPKFNCWRLFCAYKSKEYTDVSPSEKWGLASAEWAELKLNGGDQHWKELADTLNRKGADSDTSIVSSEDTTEQPKAAPKKAAKKAAAPKKAAQKAAPKKAAQKDEPIVAEIFMDSDATSSDNDNDDDNQIIFMNSDDTPSDDDKSP